MNKDRVGRSILLAVTALMIMLVSFSDHALLLASPPVSDITGGNFSNITLAGDHLQKNNSQNITKLNNSSILGSNTGNLALSVIPVNSLRAAGILADPGVFGASLTTSFNSDTMRMSDVEDINIDFSYPADNARYSPFAMLSGNGQSQANVLPFGPVNLAFPSIEQSISRSQELERTSIVKNAHVEGMSCPVISFKKTPLPAINFEI